MTLSTRPPLPTLPIPQLVKGCDTTDQANENRRRIDVYSDRLLSELMPLPADPAHPSWVGISQVGREAGVCIGTLRPGSPNRVKIEALKQTVGLATIIHDDEPAFIDAEAFSELLRRIAPLVAEQEGMDVNTLRQQIVDIMCVVGKRAMIDAGERAGSTTKVPVWPVLATMISEAEAGTSMLPDSHLALLPHFPRWAELGASATQHLGSMEFRDLLNELVRRIGVGPLALAREVCVSVNTMNGWRKGTKVPNVRSHAALRQIARLAHMPEDTLIEAVRRQAGDKPSLRRTDLPVAYEGRKRARVAASILARLSPGDYALPDEAFRSRVARLCQDVEEEKKEARDRQRLRRMNLIDRSRFSRQLRQDFELWVQDSRQQGLSPNTVTAYLKQAEAVFACGLSDSAPPNIRLDPATARLSHLASPAIWQHYFLTIEENGRQATGDSSFKTCRTRFERLKASEAMFNPRDSYVRSRPDLMAAIRTLGPAHLGFDSGDADDMDLLYRIRSMLAEVRKEWMKKARQPISGRSEIADLLGRPDPIRLVAAMIEYQRRHAFLLRDPERSRMPGDQRHYYATAMRTLIIVHLLGQTAFRVGMVPVLTVGSDAECHLRVREGEAPTLRIPSSMFKNGRSDAFKDGPYERTLEDTFGLLADLKLYLEKARPFLLAESESESNLLFPARKGARLMQGNLHRHIVDLSSRSIGANAPPGQRLIQRPCLRPHHFRDILATQVLHDTDRNYALAADAIHVTERTCRAYYAHDTPAMRRPDLQKVMRDLGRKTS